MKEECARGLQPTVEAQRVALKEEQGHKLDRPITRFNSLKKGLMSNGSQTPSIFWLEYV